MADEKKKVPSDAQILAKLRRARGGKTAAQLGTTSQRLSALEGVVRIGTVQTGQRGRPAILFGTEEHAAQAAALPNNDEKVSEGESEAELARSGAMQA